jgi:SnoaL-like protein
MQACAEIESAAMEARAMTDQEKLQVLFDRAEISEVVHRYAIGIDSRDWKLFRSIFTDEIEVWLGFATDAKPELRRRNADKFTEQAARVITQFAVTQHFLTDYHIEVNRNDAVCVCYMQARHFNPDGKGGQTVWDIGGYYTYHLTRSASGWKIPKYTLTLTWEENRPPGVRL